MERKAHQKKKKRLQDLFLRTGYDSTRCCAQFQPQRCIAMVCARFHQSASQKQKEQKVLIKASQKKKSFSLLKKQTLTTVTNDHCSLNDSSLLHFSFANDFLVLQ